MTTVSFHPRSDMGTRGLSKLGLALLSVAVFAGFAASENCLRGQCKASNAIPDWDFLLFANEWPQSFCMYFTAIQKREGCEVPKNVTNWTIHGLWPTKIGTEGPTSCNNSWPFNLSKIQDLEPALTTVWPGLRKGITYPDFWGHEWSKHGTCAASLPALRGEHNYFGISLKLFQERVNLFSILNKAGIVPSDKVEYSYDDIMRAIHTGIGVTTELICYQNTGNSHFKQYLLEVRVCLDKTLNPINCPKTGSRFAKKALRKSAYESPCSHKTTIGLPVIQH